MSFQDCFTYSLQGCPLLTWDPPGETPMGQVASMGTAVLLQSAGVACHGVTALHLCDVHGSLVSSPMALTVPKQWHAQRSP